MTELNRNSVPDFVRDDSNRCHVTVGSKLTRRVSCLCRNENFVEVDVVVAGTVSGVVRTHDAAWASDGASISHKAGSGKARPQLSEIRRPHGDESARGHSHFCV